MNDGRFDNAVSGDFVRDGGDETYEAEGLRVVDDAVLGHRVITDRIIKTGEVVAIWRAPTMPGTRARALSPRERDYLLQIDDDQFMYVGLGDLRTVDYINHSCDPNCGFTDAVTLAAMRTIDRGEVVTFDYAMSDSNSFIAFECRCGVPNCRGALSRNDWKLPDLQHRYAGWFAPHIQRLIDSQNA